ncbi:hypothetical protein AK88_05508 [Plasmodium fragile]|uniref:Schizont-infected cell agglutination extracellular alpha domain-containing protein n=1 Tax=Plasmodium fragile TaxID=5857 RepID=A0A0D9QCX9_PLAFR|nr:uncharacterized protein AK88_05508 [Plasmodium fragile]KJP84863.1 hypothetical protein AK88_05508 [Plasmodium fragile]
MEELQKQIAKNMKGDKHEEDGMAEMMCAGVPSTNGASLDDHDKQMCGLLLRLMFYIEGLHSQGNLIQKHENDERGFHLESKITQWMLDDSIVMDRVKGAGLRPSCSETEWKNRRTQMEQAAATGIDGTACGARPGKAQLNGKCILSRMNNHQDARRTAAYS